jgi:hypothetical protein
MASAWRTGLALLRAPATELSFALRSTLRWSRGPVRLPRQDQHDLFAFLPASERAAAERMAADLRQRFDLDALAHRSTPTTWLANLALLTNLQRLCGPGSPPRGPDGRVRAIDVGCGDFHYATALQRWLAGSSPRRGVVLRGIEIDGHGIYRDGHSRADHARAHAALAESAGSRVQLEVADFTGMALPEQDVVCMLFPFLSAYASLQWGLPLSRLRPARLVARAVATVRPGGWLLVANQTPAEVACLRRLLAAHPVEPIAAAPWSSAAVPWAERTRDQVGTLWRKLPPVPSAPRSG